ncbi:B-lymphocyte antigen CD20 [Bos indicus x Bos taurus]|uniref:Membrane-spanning 4-domains, subfamily A, member 1 n=2 Tax=Bos TaxID=9903 RepID=Q17QX1_BOVIN|nr:B-lymphocyte antigen CD20 [Bos taurus]XP_027418000.1 B-lymphocyte antigen CD20 [Bos indicus x Bos taurus]AAI18133.1 Membrane-spanning 4-domains, subfamily A, member 1 [Bos taurus]
MTTPRNSMVGAFPAEPLKGPIAMHAAQKVVPRRVPVVVGPTQSFFMREAKALGAVQIMNGLFHIALGSLMLIHMDVYMPICVTLWYPLWGGIMFIISGSLLAAAEKNSTQSMLTGRLIMNSLSLFAAISGIIFLIMDIFNMTISHFFKMENLNLIKTQVPYININNCERANPDENNSQSVEYCARIRFVFLSNFAVMMIFAFLQKLVTAGTVENEWKKLCSRPKANVVLLSAEEKKEQVIEIKEEVVEQIEVAEQIEISSLPKNEEDIEIIPVQEEEEEEAEMNFPEPPQDQEDSPIENDSVP